jgi:glycerophosphoryl diester phosphodiesterase
MAQNHSMSNHFGKALRMSWHTRQDLIRYSMLFRLLEAIVLTPLSAFVGHLLSGRPVLDSTEIVAFVLSVRGIAATFICAMTLLSIRLIEQTGLTVIVLDSFRQNRIKLLDVLRIVAAQLPRIVAIAGWIALVAMLVAGPLFAATAALLKPLLAKHDVNYYLAERPPEFLLSAAIIGGLGLLDAGIGVWLAVRWRLIVPVFLCEQGRARVVLHSSVSWVRGHWYRVATAWLATALLIVVLGLLSAWAGKLCAVAATRLVGEGAGTHFGAFVVLLTIRALLAAFITLPGPVVTAAVFATIYRDLRHEQEPQWHPAFQSEPGETGSGRTAMISGWMLALLPVVTLVMAVMNTFLAMGELYSEHSIAVTAHRGATSHSIENTVGAIEEAIGVGTQFAEIDVQMTKDDILVVTHDSDFSRLAGDARKVWDLTFAEIQKIPLTQTRSGETITGSIPTLDDVLIAAKGRIRLNIELKYYGDHQPALAARVVDAVRANDMTDQVIIQSLHYEGLQEVKRIAPQIPIGYLFSVNAREPERLEVDFLSVQIGRVTSSFVNGAHRRGRQVHVWTVDKTSDMQRMIQMGVDNLITNQPGEALARVRQHADSSSAEQSLDKLRTWLTE